MKIVNIQGGLGNQMFGFAIAVTLKYKFPDEEVKLDLSSYKHYKLHNGFEIYDVFDSPRFENATPKEVAKLTWYSANLKVLRLLRKIMPRRRTDCIERPVARLRKDAFTSTKDYYYDGYWQWGGYFEDIKDVIIKAFKFKVDGILTSDQESLIKDLDKNNSVGIHVRRGDYLKEKLYKGICDTEYYVMAISQIEKMVNSPIYYIFSNDIKWCKDNIPNMTKNKCVFVENKGKRSYLDMYMMTQCKHLIIANSSFSWWSAYLNKYQGVIMSPKKWVNLLIGRKMQQDNWILLENYNDEY